MYKRQGYIEYNSQNRGGQHQRSQNQYHHEVFFVIDHIRILPPPREPVSAPVRPADMHSRRRLPPPPLSEVRQVYSDDRRVDAPHAETRQSPDFPACLSGHPVRSGAAFRVCYRPMSTTAHNVDSGEIAKFEALASRWWDPTSEFKPLHDINPLRLGYIAERIELSGLRVVDIGCGGGLLAEGLARAGARVTGIDMGEAPLSVARLHLLESGLEVDYRQSTAEELAKSEPAGFDVLTCLEMLEHVPNPASVIAACAELVRPGGKVFFSTLNRNPKSYLFAIIGAEYLLHLLPKGTHDYRKFIRPSELERWARKRGLQIEDITGMTYNPLTGAYRLGDDVDVNYLACFQKT